MDMAADDLRIVVVADEEEKKINARFPNAGNS